MTTTQSSTQSASASARRLAVGTLIEDRYEVVDFLGAGGFASVYRARQMQIDREIALKVLNLGHVDDSGDFEERFVREAKIAASIKHPNIVTIHDVGVGGPLQQPFIAMELLDGHDLEVELQKHGGLDPQRCFELFEEVLDALGEGHQMGVVHKDLKPGNLFIKNPGSRREALIVLDFGVARMDEGEGARLTATGQFLGTPQYIAPEYAQFQIATPSLDVYQMALILIESLTGQPVVQSDNPMACLMAHCSGQLAIPDAIRESDLGSVLEIALAIDHNVRYPNCHAFRDALTAVMSPTLYAQLASVATTSFARPTDADIASGFTQTGNFNDALAVTGEFNSGDHSVITGDTPIVSDEPSASALALTGDYEPVQSNKGLLIGIGILLILIIAAVAFMLASGEEGSAEAASAASGPETEAPPETPPEQPPLDKYQIKGFISEHRTAVKACYDSALEANPELGSGKVALTFGIAPEGAVTEASTAENTFSDDAVATCLTDLVKGWTFPESGGVDKITYPFAFTAPESTTPEPTGTQVTFKINSKPDGADVVRGADILGTTPTEITLTFQGEEDIELVLERDDYESLPFSLNASSRKKTTKKLKKAPRTTRKTRKKRRKTEEKTEEKTVEKKTEEKKEEGDSKPLTVIPF